MQWIAQNWLINKIVAIKTEDKTFILLEKFLLIKIGCHFFRITFSSILCIWLFLSYVSQFCTVFWCVKNALNYNKYGLVENLC